MRYQVMDSRGNLIRETDSKLEAEKVLAHLRSRLDYMKFRLVEKAFKIVDNEKDKGKDNEI